MYFMKLKYNMSYPLSAVLFRSCSERHCQRDILNMIHVLGVTLKHAFAFPSVEEIARNMPMCFKGYSDTIIILDCTEIEIQKPKKLCCQLVTYLFYKSYYTGKYMTRVTPGELISFQSKPYGGRTSNKAIFEQSGLIELLEADESEMFRNQLIMLDKGFLTDDKCRE